MTTLPSRWDHVPNGQCLGDVLDYPDELIEPISMSSREADKRSRLRDDSATLGCACDGDAAAPPKLEQAFLAKLPQRSQDRIRVDAEYGGEVLGRRKPLTRFRFAMRDRASDLCGHLLVQVHRHRAAHLDVRHGATHTSF